MENNIAILCEELKAAREAKANLQSQMKEIESMITQLKDDIISAMKENGLEKCETGGYTYTVNNSYSIEKQCDPKELVRLFRLNHHSELITEYVNPHSLRTFVTEELETNDQLPSWLLGSVIVKEINRLSIQKR